MNVARARNGSHLSPLPSGTAPVAERTILNEEAFRRMISLERKRSERSRKPFVLMLLDLGRHSSKSNGHSLARILDALCATTRETDSTGWYQDESVIGVMFTEIAPEDRDRVVSIMIARVSETLRNNLALEQFNQLSVSFHVFPEEWGEDGEKNSTNPTFYPDLSRRDESRRLHSGLKRAMDIMGSILALVLFSPAFLLIPLLIKATSKGPVFFRQRRIGQFGKPFVFLKFRSMHVNNDARIHREYVTQMIAGKAEKKVDGNGNGVYKLTRDPRITRIGAFIRKTSLDELPQFINVLRGEMSLVGPRPPVPYEVEAYDVWHRRRLLEAKPGITGLWQVSGRCRVAFDEMVRLDLRYARSWTPWMDVKILARTPAAVVLGEGAH